VNLKGNPMTEIDLREVVEQVRTKFHEKGLGATPKVFMTVAPNLRNWASANDNIEELIKASLYVCFLTNDLRRSIRIIKMRSKLKDLEAFIGVCLPFNGYSCMSKAGSSIVESVIQEKFGQLGYRCEEWVGVEAEIAAGDLPLREQTRFQDRRQRSRRQRSHDVRFSNSAV
jgi:hypothetical protein